MTSDNAKDQEPSAGDSASETGEFDWFDRPESRRLLWRLLYGACIVAILLEIVLIVTHQRHSHFEGHGSHDAHAVEAAISTGASTALHKSDDHHVPTFDGWWFFYSLLGFVGCALMILSAKGLGYLLKKPTDYYGDDTLAKDEPLPEDIDEVLR